ncbi:MAG TPA: cache domain-containing protein [Candidatus Anoxymicrobiaceae bacterium]
MNGKIRVFILIMLVVAVVSAVGCGTKSTTSKTTTKAAVTKQNVVDFVNEAIAYAKANGKDKAIAEFNNPKGKFVRGELYIYAYNWEGIALANGGNPSLAGQNLIDMTDPNGVKVIQELIKVARAGGGWVDYVWPYPKTKINEPKVGYANGVDSTWWLGSGMYTKTP